MNSTSPIPPGTLSTSGVFGTLILAITGKFDGHPGYLCIALTIVAAVSISRGWQEAWKAVKAVPTSAVPQLPSGASVATAIVTAVAFMFLASSAHADGEVTHAAGPQILLTAPAPPLAAAEAAPAPTPPSVAEIALCTAQSLPGAIGKCAGLPGAPKMDDRSFYTALFGTIGAGITTMGGLLALYLNPLPIGK